MPELRPLSREDLAHLAVPREPRRIQTLRDRHHRIAEGVALGLSQRQISETCGISLSGLQRLCADPSFQELVAHKRALGEANFEEALDLHRRAMFANMTKAEALLSDKLDEALERGEPLPTRDLVAIVSDRADRLGYGKTHQNLNVNVGLAGKIEERRVARRAAQLAEGQAMVGGKVVTLIPRRESLGHG